MLASGRAEEALGHVLRIPVLMLAALMLGGLLSSAGCSRGEPSWNVLVLVPDTVRGDHLSINGYGRETPALDRLAREGINFSAAVTVAPRTWQSFSSILTGLYPTRHGVRHLFDHPIAADTPTIASTLREHGYAVAAFDPLTFVKGMTGGTAFDEYIHPRKKGRAVADEDLVDLVYEWMAASQRPFLAFVRLSGAHWPYKDTRWLAEGERCDEHDHAFNRGSYGTKVAGPGQGLRLEDAGAFRRLIWEADYDEATLRHMIAHYDSELRRTDELIGGLIERMRSSGLLERTIVVVTSDHGESFGEHGYMQHGPRVDEPVMRVPLLMRLPERHPEHASGVEVEELVRVVDIYPTVLAALGIAVPPTLDGVSVLPALRGETLGPLWAYGETGRSFMGLDPERHFPGVEGKHRMIRSGDTKLVFVPDRSGGTYRLYDLRSDPGELRDVSADDHSAREELSAHLREVFAAEEEPSPEREISEAEMEMLRRLGYAE